MRGDLTRRGEPRQEAPLDQTDSTQSVRSDSTSGDRQESPTTTHSPDRCATCSGIRFLSADDRDQRRHERDLRDHRELLIGGGVR